MALNVSGMWYFAHRLMKNICHRRNKKGKPFSSSPSSFRETKSYILEGKGSFSFIFKISLQLPLPLSALFLTICTSSPALCSLHVKGWYAHTCAYTYSSSASHTILEIYLLHPQSLYWIYKLCNNSFSVSISWISFCKFNATYPLLLIWHLELIDLLCGITSLVESE